MFRKKKPKSPANHVSFAPPATVETDMTPPDVRPDKEEKQHESESDGEDGALDLLTPPSTGEMLKRMIEIKSCRDLLPADKGGTSDPYVKLSLGERELHRTKHIRKTLNPTFDDSTKARFNLDCNALEVFQKGGLEVEIKDWDRGLGSNDRIGFATLPFKDIHIADNEPHEYPIKISKEDAAKLKYATVDGSGEAGFVTIRCRPCTLGDKQTVTQKLFRQTMKVRKPDNVSQASFGSSSMDAADLEDKIFKIEILSCKELLARDKSGLSDPYVKVSFDGEYIHETSHISDTLNPVYTEETKNSFILDYPAMELFQKRGLHFKLKDHDKGHIGILKNETLGTLEVPADIIYHGFTAENEYTKEFKIQPPKGSADEAGYMTLKCYPVSKEDSELFKKPKSLYGRITNIPQIGKSRKNFADAPPSDTDLSLLIEIVSIQNLHASFGHWDPFVKVKLKNKDVHKTKVVKNSSDPIFTVETGSVFILDVVKSEFMNESLFFKIKDFDLTTLNDDLGHAEVSGKELCETTGERKSYKITFYKEVKRKEKKGDAFLNLRCRPATPYDRKFIAYLKSDQKTGFLALEKQRATLMDPIGGSRELLREKLSTVENGERKYRIRPISDPERPKATKWLSDIEIQRESLKPSKKWIEMGTGTLGRAFVEVIGADDIPVLDKTIRPMEKAKSDPFATLIYEDCAAKTDIIRRCLSPRWLPWMQRAFIINLGHPSSEFFIGVFDSDEEQIGGKLVGKDHDLAGRVSIGISHFEVDTEYLLTYPLYNEAIASDRESRGTVTLRLRIEYNSPRELVLASLKMPTDFYINTRKKINFDVVQEVLHGETNPAKYSLQTINHYSDELFSYLYVQYYIKDAIISLLFWRGQVPFFKFKIPLHSAIAFYAAITLVENPFLYFSYFWLGNAWLLLAIQSWQNSQPNPWVKTKSFVEILKMFVLDKACNEPEAIPSEYKKHEIMDYDEKMKRRITEAEEAAKKRQEEEERLTAEHEKKMAGLSTEAHNDIETFKEKTGIGILALFKPFLFPIQQYLALALTYLRLLRNIYLWNEPFFAFFITSASLVLGIIFYFVPWAFITRWTSRIVAWGVFGPHMKLVDIFYYRNLNGLSDEQVKEKLMSEFKLLETQTRMRADEAFKVTETAVKRKAVMEVLFGHWISRIPTINNQERYLETPLIKSSAKPLEKEEIPTIDRSKIMKVGGQNLVGTMIPRVGGDNSKKEKSE